MGKNALSVKVDNLSHLSSKEISCSSNKNIVIDALYLSSQEISVEGISNVIREQFGVNMPMDRIIQILELLQKDLFIISNSENLYSLADATRVDITNVLKDAELCKERAIRKWIENKVIFKEEITPTLYEELSTSLDQFLSEIFIQHGAASYKFLNQTSETVIFDINMTKKLLISIQIQLNT